MQPNDVPDLITPSAKPGLLNGPSLPALLARLGAGWAAGRSGPFRIGSTVVATRHADVVEMLSRDLDFRIGPVNARRIDAVNGPFVLGMDRGVRLVAERHALYQALARVDLRPIEAAVASMATARLEACGGSIDVVNGYARPIAAATAERLFGIAGDLRLMQVARAIFAHTFLNVTSDHVIERRALTAAPLLRGWLDDEIARRRATGSVEPDLMGALLQEPGLDDDTVRRTLGGMLVGSIDTTATAVAKIMAMLCRDPPLRRQVAADLDDPARLAGWCWEVLRRWPHNPVLLRRAETDTRLGTTRVRAGDRVVGWVQAAMQDASVFPEPGRLRCDRPRSAYLHFGGGLHPCAGRAINGLQIPLLVAALLRSGVTRAGRMAWAGPFPDRLIVRLGARPA